MDVTHADAAAARKHLDAQGWIARKAESFRHLPPPPAAQWLGEAALLDEAAAVDDGWSLLPVAGAASAGVEVRRFDATDAAQRTELFAGLPAPGDDEAAPFAWAHRALVRRALRLRVAAGTAPAWLHLAHRASSVAEAPLLVVELAPGAQCVLLETHERAGAAAGAQNLQVHVKLAQGAQLQHLRVAAPAAGDRIAHHVHVQLQASAQYHQALLATGSEYHLQRNVFELQGDGAGVRSGGVLLATGNALEQQIHSRHAAPRTTSSNEVLALASGAARVVANAHTRIAAGCDDADVRQRLAGIPTGGQPRIVLRPHLEILHDQVQAVHGATWGALPQEALFHARQRGLDEEAAKALILEGLARAALLRAVGELPDGLALDGRLAALVRREPLHG
jgi:Fe-S cluster assembly protein SufD